MGDHVNITVALAGNPNSGKTSLFNELVGANQKVGNFSGVTVEKIEGSIKFKDYLIRITDLPGTYSLTAYSPEELVARNFIIETKPDVIVNVVDGTNLDRNLYLSTQLMELDKPFIIAINMYDEVLKNKTQINIELLSNLFGIPIVPTSSRNKTGISELLQAIVTMYLRQDPVQHKVSFQAEIEKMTSRIIECISQDSLISEQYPLRWFALKLLENDEQVYKSIKDRPVWIKLHPVLTEAHNFIESNLGQEAELCIVENRHSFIKGALKETVTLSFSKRRNFTEILDKILINRVTGLPVFLIFMWGIFQLVFKLGEKPVEWIGNVFDWLGAQLFLLPGSNIIKSIIADGIIGGVGSVMSFLPNIMLLFLALAFLEGTGYMARAAFVIDKVMHYFGLHGKSAISLITGLGCSVPAFMSTRTLKSKSDRITTLLIIPFISCGAKLPVYILIIGAFFNPNIAGNILFGIYIFGILVALFSAKFFKAFIFKGESEPFVMELPPYRMPSPKSLLFQMWHKASQYLRKAATIILIASVLIWLGSNFPQSTKIRSKYETIENSIKLDNALSNTEKVSLLHKIKNEETGLQLKNSIVGQVGTFIEPVIRPLGFDWRIGISLLTGIAAKEIVVSTMATIFSIGEVKDGKSFNLQKVIGEQPDYSKATAISLILFVLLYVPCIAATTVFHREAGQWKWTILYFTYSMLLAWIFAFIGFEITSLII